MDLAEIQSPPAGLKLLDTARERSGTDKVNFEACPRKGVVKLFGIGKKLFDVLKNRCRLLTDRHALIVRKTDSEVNALLLALRNT